VTGPGDALVFAAGTVATMGTPCTSAAGGTDPRVWLGDEPEVGALGWTGEATEGAAEAATALAAARAGARPPVANATTRTMAIGIRIRALNKGDTGEDEASSGGAHRTCRQNTDSPDKSTSPHFCNCTVGRAA
jgi:hypothetical protein